MLMITNRAAIDEAFNAKAPRPIHEVIMEIYPDAVRDANDRYHAPHDGYECPITGQIFRGGEYLPFDREDDEVRRIDHGRKTYPHGKIVETGETVEWYGTRAQNIVAWGELIAQSKAYDAARSTHVGTVGQMIELTLTLEFVKAWEGYYGLTFLHILKDAAGNVFVYKGSKRLATGTNRYFDRNFEKGETFKLRAKVKAHGERDGVKQTIIERPKVQK